METTSPLLDAQQAADWVGLSTSKFANLRLTGNGPAYFKLGRRVVYRIADLEDWIQTHRHKPSPIKKRFRGLIFISVLCGWKIRARFDMTFFAALLFNNSIF